MASERLNLYINNWESWVINESSKRKAGMSLILSDLL